MNKLTRIAGALLGAMVLAATITGGAAAAGTNRPAVDAQVLAIGARDLTAAEADGLLFMREEEKLARDVYATLYDRWGLSILANISRSEQTHMDAIEGLLEVYDLEDPVAGRDAGEYANSDLQALYDRLTIQGAQSLVEALRVGAAIEEIDILDLQERLASTNHPALEQVYQNLLRGSENHLRAFVSVLERQGSAYDAQYLDQEAFAEILDGAAQPVGTRGRPSSGSGRRGRP